MQISIIILIYSIYSFCLYFIPSFSNSEKPKTIVEKMNAQLTESERLLETDRNMSFELALKVFDLADSIGLLPQKARATLILAKAKALAYSNEESVKYFMDAIKMFTELNDTSFVIESLLYLGTKNIEIGNDSIALSQLKTCLNYYKVLRDNKKIIMIYRSIGLYYYYENNFEKALEYFYKCLEIAKSESITDYYSYIYYMIGYSYIALCIYDKSLEFAFLTLKESDIKTDQYTKAMSYHLIAEVYSDLKNFSKSLFYNLLALEIKLKINDKFLIASSYKSIGLNYFNMAHYDSSLSYFKKALLLEKDMNYKQGEALSLNCIGDVYFIYGDLVNAKSYYTQAYQQICILKDNWGIAKISVNLGKMYNKIGNRKSAYFYLQKGLFAAKRVKARDIMLNCYYHLSDFYQSSKQFEQANIYLKNYLNLKDSIIVENTHKVGEMQLRYENDKKDREKEILKNKIDIQNLQIQRKSLVNMILFLGLFFVIFAVVLIAYLNRTMKKTNQNLKEKVNSILAEYKKQQQIICHQSSLTSLGEMTASISHEINQALQDIVLTTESLNEAIKNKSVFEDGVKEINNDILRISQTVDHVRCFSSLQSEQIDEYFLITDSISDALNLMQRQLVKHNIILNFDFSNDTIKIHGNRYKFEQVILNLLSNAKDAIIHKQKECITNYIGTIKISVWCYLNYHEIRVCDNGIGIDKNHKNNIFEPFYTTKKIGKGTGLGLAIAKNIISEMGGSIYFQSDKNNETIFIIKIPRNQKF